MTTFGTTTHIFETGTAATGMLLHLVQDLPIATAEQEELMVGITEIYAPLITVMALSSTAKRVHRLRDKLDTVGREKYPDAIVYAIDRVSQALLKVLTEESDDNLKAIKTAIRTRWPEVAAQGDAMTSEEIQETVAPMKATAAQMMAAMGIVDEQTRQDETLMENLTELAVAVLLAMPPETFSGAYQDLRETGLNMTKVDEALAAEVMKRRSAKMSTAAAPQPEEPAPAEGSSEKVSSDD